MVDLYTFAVTIEGEMTETEWEGLDDRLHDGRATLAAAIREVVTAELDATSLRGDYQLTVKVEAG